jgi:RimJ/RimL family protein N-acetyltransferase
VASSSPLADGKDALTAYPRLETPRLILRPWQESDREPFAALNADPAVMRYFVAPMTRQECDEAIDRYLLKIATEGFGFLAVELRATGEFAGLIGIQTIRDQISTLPPGTVEIGWRLTQRMQGQGLTTEGAKAVLDFAFTQLHLPQVIAFTIPINAPSRRVMEKLGMTERPELSFLHPRIPDGHPYQPHVVYSIANPHSKTSQEA